MYNVLNFVFTLTVNTYIDLQTHKDNSTKIYYIGSLPTRQERVKWIATKSSQCFVETWFHT